MDENAKMQRFFNACDDLIGGKFILADTKIGEVLRAIATSEELTRLFAALTDGFDYPAAKAAYLREPDGQRGVRGEAFLPSERKDILAFVFCLLVDFDGGQIKFNDFLLSYFYEDGSYTASYEIFVGRMIRPFRDIVRSCFPNYGKQTYLRETRTQTALERLSEKVALERSRLASFSLEKEDRTAGEMMLSELYAAVGRGDAAEIKALLCGYLYFLQAVGRSGGEDDNAGEMFAIAFEL